jgi:hypothetical protein
VDGDGRWDLRRSSARSYKLLWGTGHDDSDDSSREGLESGRELETKPTIDLTENHAIVIESVRALCDHRPYRGCSVSALSTKKNQLNSGHITKKRASPTLVPDTRSAHTQILAKRGGSTGGGGGGGMFAVSGLCG